MITATCIASERLGHSTVVLTLDTYSHVLPDMQQQAAERIENLLSRPDLKIWHTIGTQDAETGS